MCSERLERLHDLFRACVDNGDMAGAATLIAPSARPGSPPRHLRDGAPRGGPAGGPRHPVPHRLDDQADHQRRFGGAETLAAAVARIGRLPLPFHPGESWAYGFSTDVLGRLVEVVSGVDLAEFFQTRIFDPLGMHDTHFYLPPVKVERLARVYTRTERAATWSGIRPSTPTMARPRSSRAAPASLRRFWTTRASCR